MSPRRILAALAVGAALTTAVSGTAHADPVHVTLYRDVPAPRPCTRAERAAEEIERGDTCTVRPESDGYVEGPAWCWPDEDAPDWVQRLQRRQCS